MRFLKQKRMIYVKMDLQRVQKLYIQRQINTLKIQNRDLTIINTI